MYDEDPVGRHNYIVAKKKEWDQKMKESNGTLKELIPGGKEDVLKQQIRKKYGGKFAEIISTPAFIRGKVISISKQTIKTDIREPYDNLASISKINLTVFIEEVLKGEKFFTEGTTITVSYSLGWLVPSFQINKSYLFPLRPWFSLREYKGEITLRRLYFTHEHEFPFDGGIDQEIYPIENNMVFSKENFFDTGTMTS